MESFIMPGWHNLKQCLSNKDCVGWLPVMYTECFNKSHAFLYDLVPFLWCCWLCGDNLLPSGSFCSKPQAGLLHISLALGVWDLLSLLHMTKQHMCQISCALWRSTWQNVCWMLMLWMHWGFQDVQWPSMGMSSLLCEHFVQLLNAQVEAQTLRRGLPHNWKSYRNKAVAQSMLGEDLRKITVGEAGYPVALPVPDSWKMCLLQPKVRVSSLLLLLVLIKPGMLAKAAVCPLMHRSFV